MSDNLPTSALPRTTQHRTATLSAPHLASPLRISYLDTPASPSASQPGRPILLLHGFPKTSFQYRRVIGPLSRSGHRSIVPDLPGLGHSSPLPAGATYSKTAIAAVIVALLDRLSIGKVHVVGTDIGGMVAFAVATRFPSRAASLLWGECPLPGSEAYYGTFAGRETAARQFHFLFHAVAELPEALVRGREGVYVRHFYEELCHDLSAVTEAELDYYARCYAKPGALRSAFGLYRAFGEDAAENEGWLREEGRLGVPTRGVVGEFSRHTRGEAEGMMRWGVEGGRGVDVVEGAGHYVAEENPGGFVGVVVRFLAELDAQADHEVPLLCGCPGCGLLAVAVAGLSTGTRDWALGVDIRDDDQSHETVDDIFHRRRDSSRPGKEEEKFVPVVSGQFIGDMTRPDPSQIESDRIKRINENSGK